MFKYIFQVAMRNFKLLVTDCDYSGQIKYQISQEDGRCLGRLIFLEI